MIKCKVTGNSKDTFEVQKVLCRICGHEHVRSGIPEAAYHRANRCSSDFIVDAGFIDLQELNRIKHPRIEIQFSDMIYVKKENRNGGFWKHIQ